VTCKITLTLKATGRSPIGSLKPAALSRRTLLRQAGASAVLAGSGLRLSSPSNIPEVDAKTYRMVVGGEGPNGHTEITFDALRKMPAYEVVAVNQCSGNRRGLSQPHVADVEWGYQDSLLSGY
jgi:DMSO/TMAO reductase YedYZ molybdopterin-dependent catalytic subunit